MKVNVTARHFDLTPDLKDHAEKKLAKFRKYTDGLLTAHVVLEVEKYRNIAEISVHGREGDFTGRVESADMLTSIDGAMEKVEKQIRRTVRKLRKHNGNGAKEELPMGETRIEAQRVRREMMTLEEATTRMEDGEEIVVFADTDTGTTRIVYRRPDGTVKLLEVAG